jgi:hypothetical protein
MSKQTLYIDMARHGLIACQFLGYAPTPLELGFNVVVKVKTQTSLYDKGEILYLPFWAIVQKAYVRDYKQHVKTAILPAITDSNILPKPIYS